VFNNLNTFISSPVTMCTSSCSSLTAKLISFDRRRLRSFITNLLPSWVTSNSGDVKPIILRINQLAPSNTMQRISIISCQYYNQSHHIDMQLPLTIHTYSNRVTIRPGFPRTCPLFRPLSWRVFRKSGVNPVLHIGTRRSQHIPNSQH